MWKGSHDRGHVLGANDCRVKRLFQQCGGGSRIGAGRQREQRAAALGGAGSLGLIEREQPALHTSPTLGRLPGLQRRRQAAEKKKR
jgi:hypothetical protein